MEKLLEQSLLEEALKNIEGRRDEVTQYIVSLPLERDEYLERVGYLRALNEVKDDFIHLHDTFFPKTSDPT